MSKLIYNICFIQKEMQVVNILKCASAGTLESSDVYVEVEPSNNGLLIDLDSVVIEQFGEKIKEVVKEVFAEQDVKNATVRLQDKGALECVIRARVESAILRGRGEL